MLYLVGLGLYSEKDITVAGLEIVQKCSQVYLEAYTSVLHVEVDVLGRAYGRNDIVVADREMVELEADRMIEAARESDVAFLVVGDPFG